MMYCTTLRHRQIGIPFVYACCVYFKMGGGCISECYTTINFQCGVMKKLCVRVFVIPQGNHTVHLAVLCTFGKQSYFRPASIKYDCTTLLFTLHYMVNILDFWKLIHLDDSKEVLELIHTSDLLGVNYCVNFSVHTFMKNGYTTHYCTFQFMQKLTK